MVNKKEHKFIGVGLYTGYVEDASIAGAFIGCADGIFYRDPVKMLKNLANCFSAAYITEHVYEERRWYDDPEDRFEDFKHYVYRILQGTNEDLGEAHRFLFEEGPFDMCSTFTRSGDWLIINEHGEEIISYLAFGKPWSERFYEGRGGKETVSVMTVSDYDEIEIEL